MLEVSADNKKRCFGNKEGQKFYADYHDFEWGRPTKDDRLIFEMLILGQAQAGLSWETILKRRAGYQAAFFNFDPERVSKITPSELEKMLQNPEIIRNKLKINAAIKNAKVFLRLQAEHGSFAKYIWGFVNNKPIIGHYKNSADAPVKTALSDKIAAELKKEGMSFVGSVNIYAFLESIGIAINHTIDCHCYKQTL